MAADLFDNSDSAVPAGMSAPACCIFHSVSSEHIGIAGINPPMALDVQWLRSQNSSSHCLVGALRNGYLWAGDATNACMGAIETPLSALSCVTAWQSDSGSFAAAAGQGSAVLVYSIGCKDDRIISQDEVASVSASAVTKKKKKKARLQFT